jgi:hypothetical protein
MGSGTARKIFSAFSSAVGSWKPKILSGGVNGAGVEVSWLGAIVESVRTQARTALIERTNPDLLMRTHTQPHQQITSTGG